MRAAGWRFLFLCSLMTSSESSLWADIKLHALFTDHAILQRGRAAKIWGHAEAGERVAVTFRGQRVETIATENGEWLVSVDPKEAGGPFTLTLTGKNTIELKNVLVGDVWVCSGQSNMGWPVATRPGSKELLGTENTSIRLYSVSHQLMDQQSKLLGGRWRECEPESLIDFSAVAYYFGRDLQKAQQIPIGLIHASYGGSSVMEWISGRAVINDPELIRWREKRFAESLETARKNERLKPEIERYQTAVAHAKAKGIALPPSPRGVPGYPVTSRLFNGMISPLLPFGIRGVIWYQGEADISQCASYRLLFGTLIRSWRQDWQQGDFPFLFVQIAPHLKIVDHPQESDWAALREAQRQTSHEVTNTGMVVITDWGHETDIHVKEK